MAAPYGGSKQWIKAVNAHYIKEVLQRQWPEPEGGGTFTSQTSTENAATSTVLCVSQAWICAACKPPNCMAFNPQWADIFMCWGQRQQTLTAEHRHGHKVNENLFPDILSPQKQVELSWHGFRECYQQGVHSWRTNMFPFCPFKADIFSSCVTAHADGSCAE